MTPEQRADALRLADAVMHPEAAALLRELAQEPQQTDLVAAADAVMAHQWSNTREAIDALTRLVDAAHEHAEQQAEPDMRHPKIQALIGGKARLSIELSLVEQLLDDPAFEPTAMDMEYWGPLHDKLNAVLNPQAEPVAWVKDGRLAWHIPTPQSSVRLELLRGEHPLYLHPPQQRRPLSESEIYRLHDESRLSTLTFARAIEAAHGIGETK